MIEPIPNPNPEENAPPDAAQKKKFEPARKELRDSLERLGRDRGWSRSVLGVKLGVHASYVSKFINGSNDFIIGPMERAVEDLLKSAQLSSDAAVELFPTFITRRITGVFETARKTSDVALIFSAAGLGKTSACWIERTDRPLTLFLTAVKGGSSAGAMQSQLFELLENRSYDQQTLKRTFIRDRLKNSGRLLLIDNGQRLYADALQYFFDLHDETGIPVVILGNPEVEKTIRRNDQMFSRIGAKEDIALPPFAAAKAEVKKNVAEVVDGILSQMIPAWAAEIRDLGLQIAWQRGHFRALRKTITLAHELSLQNPALHEPRKAMAAAHTKLVRDYTLEGLE